MFMVRVFEDLGRGKGIVASERVVVKFRRTEDIVGLLKEPFDLRGREDELWMAREVWEDVGKALFGILVPIVSSHSSRT